MSRVTSLSVELTAGGRVTLVIDVDWLSAPDDDLAFVREMYRRVVDYVPAVAAAPTPPVSETPPLPEPPPAMPPRKAPKADTSGQRTRRHQPVRCPECGQQSGSAAGLAQHRKHKHGVAPASAETLPAPVRAQSPQVPGKVFRCADCPAEFATIPGLTSHALQAHRRPPHQGERTPVAPAEAAA